MSRRQKKKQSQASQKPLMGKKHSWSRGDIFAAIGLLIAIMSALLSLSIPEVRRIVGLDRSSSVSANPLPSLTEQPTPNIYRLKQKYVSNLIQAIGSESAPSTNTSEELSLYFDWESPEGDFTGYMTNSVMTFCPFVGKITGDMHFSFQCSDSNKSFSGYVYLVDGHIKGVVGHTQRTMW